VSLHAGIRTSSLEKDTATTKERRTDNMLTCGRLASVTTQSGSASLGGVTTLFGEESA